MKSAAIVFAIVASLGFGSLAQAQGNDRRNQGNEWPDQRMDRPMTQRTEQRADHWQDRRFDQRGERWNERRPSYNARGPEFRRGGYMPREYRNPAYFIGDYRTHHLPPPPRNHQWVQVGADYVLIAIATGIIANIVLSQ